MKQKMKQFWEKSKKRFKRFLCAISVSHRWEKEVYRSKSGFIQIMECSECGSFLNINHQMEQAYVSTENTLGEDMKMMDELLERIMPND